MPSRLERLKRTKQHSRQCKDVRSQISCRGLGRETVQLRRFAKCHVSVDRGRGNGKFKRALGFLARPLTILRLLLRTARLLPGFRNIAFRYLEPAEPIRIAKQFRITAKEAWLALGLPEYCAQLPKTLEGRMNDFRFLCSRPFSVHAEVQLLLYYQENPGRSPTMDYIC